MEREELRKVAHTVDYELLGSPSSYTDEYHSKQYTKDLETELKIDHHPFPRLITVWHTQETDPKNTANAFKTKLTLKPQPTEDWLEFVT